MPPNDQLSVSVIIPTKNRPVDLELTLRTLMDQSVLPEQLIIVDQSAGDESFRRVDSLLCSEPKMESKQIDLHYVRDDRISGGAAARNRAMSVARGDIWLFLDDDVCLEPSFLEGILAVYGSRSDAVGVSGIVTNYRRPPAVFRCWDRLFVCGPFHDDRQPIYWNSENPVGSHPIPVSRLGGGLMSFRADAIRDLRFDENLSGVSDGEDVDFCCRLPKGVLLMIAPRARLTHNQSAAGRSQQHWLNRHARAYCFLYRKNWSGKRMNWFYFAWLNIGYCLVACLASLRRGSLNPWRDLIDGIRRGYSTGPDENRKTSATAHILKYEE